MKRPLVVLLSMALLAFGVFHALHDPASAPPGTAMPAGPATARSAIPAAADRPPVEADAADAAAASAPVRPAEARTPTWLLPTPRPAVPNPATTPTAAATAQEKIARLNAVLQKLNRLQAQPDIDARAASAAIAELEQINGSAVMNGVRLDVLRQNVEVADRIQATAAELQRLQKSTAAPSPEQAALVQSKTAELMALQSHIRHDIMQPPGDVGPRP